MLVDDGAVRFRGEGEAAVTKVLLVLRASRGKLLTPALEYFGDLNFFLAPDDARPGSRGGSYWRVLRLRWAGVMPLGFES